MGFRGIKIGVLEGINFQGAFFTTEGGKFQWQNISL
jgi:hypothetical protein